MGDSNRGRALPDSYSTLDQSQLSAPAGDSRRVPHTCLTRERLLDGRGVDGTTTTRLSV
jgi:hypothetical protein